MVKFYQKDCLKKSNCNFGRPFFHGKRPKSKGRINKLRIQDAKKSATDPELISLVEELDHVFYFVSPASQLKSQELELETPHANTIGTENLIKLALKNEPEEFLHLQVKFRVI